MTRELPAPVWFGAALVLACLVLPSSLAAVPESAALPPPSCDSPTRQWLSLHGAWEYQAAADAEQEIPGEDGWATEELPAYTKTPDSRHGWFRRTVDIPAEWAGRAIALRADAIAVRAGVSVNGQALPPRITAGRVPHLFDITPLVRSGGPNEILLHVWNRDSLRLDMTRPAGERNMLYPEAGDFGVVDNIGLQALPACHVANVRVRTAMRRNEISVDAWVTNAGQTPFHGAVSARVETLGLLNADIHAREHDRADLPNIEPVAVDVPPGQTVRVTLSAPWAHPVLWWPDYPFLYKLHAGLAADGQPVDEYPVQFGFREVWRDGPEMILNGAVFRIRTAFTSHKSVYHDAKMFESRVRYMRRWNYNLFRTHKHPWASRAYRAADELGLGMVLESSASFGSKYALESPAFWVNYADHVRRLVAHYWNHPSILVWSAENELMSQSRRLDPDGFFEENLAKIGRLYKELDPTRLIMFEGDMDPGGVADFINEHYPIRYGSYMLPQDAYFVDKPRQVNCAYKRGTPWKWDRKKPYFIGESLWFPSGGPLPHAAFMGDRVFAEYMQAGYADGWRMDDTQLGAKLMYATAYRWQGVTAFVIQTSHKDLQDVRGDIHAPIALFVREMPGAHFGGHEAVYNVLIGNGSYQAHDLELGWRLELDGRAVAGDAEQVRIDAGRDARRTVRFTVPKVARRRKALLTLDLTGGGTLQDRDILTLRFYPASVPQVDAAGKKTGLFDPGGSAVGPLRRMGLPAAGLAAIDAASIAGLDLLIIGPDALADTALVDADALLARVAAGMNVLVLDQTARAELGWLPVETTIEESVGATVAHAPTSHAVLDLAGIEAADLKFWAPDNVVADVTLVKPWQGNHRTVVEVGAGNGLLYTAVLELPHGRGTFILNQARCIAKFDWEPAARALLAGAVEYCLAAAREPQRLAVLAQPNSLLTGSLSDLNVAHDNFCGRLAGTVLNNYGVLMVDSAPATWEELTTPDNERALFGFVHKRGGTLWVHDAGPPAVPPLCRFLKRLPITVNDWPAGEGRPVHKLADHALLRGLSNQTLWWAPPNISSGKASDWTRMQDPMVAHRLDLSTESTPPGAVTRLLTHSALVYVRLGNGGVLLDQVRWAENVPYRAKGFQYASVLLTNLGIQIGRRQVRDVPEQACVFIDLSGHCNQAFVDGDAGDGKGGWTDQGPGLDLRNLPVGAQKLAGVPFRIVDPGRNNGRGCAVMRGERGLTFPERIDGIPVNTAVERMYILHGSAWAKSGQKLGEYVFTYADGQKERLAVVEGTHVHDWYWGAMTLPNAEPAWVGDAESREGVALYCTVWENPRPDVPVASVGIVAGTVGPMMEGVLPSGMLGVVAMTGVRADHAENRNR